MQVQEDVISAIGPLHFHGATNIPNVTPVASFPDARQLNIFRPNRFGSEHIELVQPMDSSKIPTGWWFGTFFIFPYIGNNHHPID